MNRPLLNMSVIHWVLVVALIAAALLLHFTVGVREHENPIGLYAFIALAICGIIIHARTQSHD